MTENFKQNLLRTISTTPTLLTNFNHPSSYHSPQNANHNTPNHCSKNTTLSGGGKNTTRIAIISTLLLFLFSFSASAQANTQTLFFNVSAEEFRIGSANGTSLNNTFPEYIGKWEYNNATNTLTLTDFVWETSARTALQIVGSCTLYVEGTNTFTSTLPSNTSGFSRGIYTESPLTISGDRNGILNATGGTTGYGGSASYGILASGGNNNNAVSITISGGIVNATGGTVGRVGASASDSYGIYANSGNTVSITISGGTVNAIGGTVMGEGYSYGIYANSGNSGNTVSIAISGGTVNATGGTVGDIYSYSYGIFANSSGSCNITISGTVVAKGHTRAIHQNSGTPTFPASRYRWTANTDYNNAKATRETGTNPPDAYAYSTGDKYIKIALVPQTFRGNNIIVRGGASLIIGKP